MSELKFYRKKIEILLLINSRNIKRAKRFLNKSMQEINLRVYVSLLQTNDFGCHIKGEQTLNLRVIVNIFLPNF